MNSMNTIKTEFYKVSVYTHRPHTILKWGKHREMIQGNVTFLEAVIPFPNRPVDKDNIKWKMADRYILNCN